MLFNKSSRLSCVVLGCAFLLTGCASSFFPDFEDTDEVVIDAGGNVEVKEISKKGILVSDKENAAYEEDELFPEVNEDEKVEHVEPAKVVSVEAEVIDPVVPSNEEVKAKEVALAESSEVVEAKEEPVAPVELPEVKNEEASVEEGEEEIDGPTMHYLAGTVYFENGGAVVGSNYRQLLKKIAKIAKENDATVTVYGFASSRTRDTDPASHKLANFKVSADRAENTVKVLIRAGVNAEKITSQAMSDSMPMYQEVMPEGERLNRRAEIYLTY